eukprot:scaffold92845_cov72-Phaeocystis_antarctica.AAC.1
MRRTPPNQPPILNSQECVIMSTLSLPSAANACNRRGSLGRRREVGPAEERPVLRGADRHLVAVGEAVDDDRDHREAEADDEDHQVGLEGHELAVSQRLGEHRERVAHGRGDAVVV